MLDINYGVYFGDETKLDNINVCVWIKRCLGEHYRKITNPRVPGTKALDCFMANSAFLLSKVNQTSTWSSWRLSG